METLTISDSKGIRLITLDRPNALNAFSSLLMDELAESFLSAEQDKAVKVVVLTGAGRAFSAGADLADTSNRTPIHGLAGMLEAIVDFSKPFLLAVNGLGVGIGATICGLADFTYIAEGARLRTPFSSLGLTAEAASTFTFPNLMGRQKASWMLMAAEWIDAEQAIELGLAMEIHPVDKLLPHVMAQADKLARLPLASLVGLLCRLTAAGFRGHLGPVTFPRGSPSSIATSLRLAPKILTEHTSLRFSSAFTRS